MARKKQKDTDEQKTSQMETPDETPIIDDSAVVKISDLKAGVYEPSILDMGTIKSFDNSFYIKPIQDNIGLSLEDLYKTQNTILENKNLTINWSSAFQDYVLDNRIAVADLVTTSTKIEQDLEDEISNLKKENRTLVDELIEKRDKESEHKQEIEELKKKIQDSKLTIQDKERLQNLFYRVHPIAWSKLQQSEQFRESFSQKTEVESTIVAIDIRRSTELMLRAKDAISYQSFIVSLCAKLRQIILDNFGVFDKFTGDGILAFFPQFYSGEDSVYLAVKAAQECHDFFRLHYKQHRSCFTTVLSDSGLGIGIDYGTVNLVNIHDWLTVIGRPVVHACRLSGAPSGITLLNQQAHDMILARFGSFVNFEDVELAIKHEGTIIGYKISLSEDSPSIDKPEWYEQDTETTESKSGNGTENSD